MSSEPSCPMCKRPISGAYVKFGAVFPCPHCSESLFVPRSYSLRMTWIALPGAVLIAYLLEARNWWLLLVAAAIYFPVAITVGYFYRKIIPPDLLVGDRCA